MNKLMIWTALAVAATTAQAADIYVSLETGKNKNEGTKEAPLKNLWKALEKAETGDTIYVAGAKEAYPGKATSKGTFRMEKPVSIIGGYAPDFASRDPLKYRTLFQAKNDSYVRGNNLGVLHLEFDKTMNAPKGFKMKIDGLIFDEGQANSYHATKGKPEGFDTGMWLEGPAKNIADKQVSPNRYMIYSATASRGEGDIEIENCAFVNCGNIAVNLNWYKGNVEIENCVFVNSRMIGASVACSAAVPMDGPSKPRAGWKPEVKWEFENNTVLYTWSRLNDLADMGFGVRVNTGVEAEIENNIIGLNVLTGFDNTKGVASTKKIKIDGNVFFLNRESDIQMTASPSVVKVRVDEFEDLEGTDGIESIEDNEDLKDPSVFKGRLNAQFLNAFLSMKYSESTKLDEGKCNGLRSVLGLPLQGTIKTQCDMFCNRYPLEDALKLFGAISGKGAQAIK
ncbi:MAG: right-handed parallel beta-helix repeat-containing protein [Kiritimatiellae bacterium]|nr:right-handed parallel beta-helix repeat-containing protein [Kiritimatiellia bacterium]